MLCLSDMSVRRARLGKQSTDFVLYHLHPVNCSLPTSKEYDYWQCANQSA